MSVEERSMWTLDGEHELQELVDLADGWLEKHQAFLDIDGRKYEIRNAISLINLRNIVAEGNAINVNMGTSLSKIVRILNKAENWY
jgi:PLU-1-like protein